MPGRVIATVAPYTIDAATKKLLNLKGDFSFIALPDELLEKHGIKSFDVILDDNKIMLVAAATNENKPTVSKRILS